MAITRSHLAGILLAAGKFNEASTLARESFAVFEARIDDWRRYAVESLVGGCRLAAGDPAGAENLLRHGYEGLAARASRIPAIDQFRIREALERLVALDLGPQSTVGIRQVAAAARTILTRAPPEDAWRRPKHLGHRPDISPLSLGSPSHQHRLTPKPPPTAPMPTNEITIYLKLCHETSLISAFTDSQGTTEIGATTVLEIMSNPDGNPLNQPDPTISVVFVNPDDSWQREMRDDRVSSRRRAHLPVRQFHARPDASKAVLIHDEKADHRLQPGIEQGHDPGRTRRKYHLQVRHLWVLELRLRPQDLHARSHHQDPEWLGPNDELGAERSRARGPGTPYGPRSDSPSANPGSGRSRHRWYICN